MITEIVSFKKFGRAIRLDNGKIEAYLTIDIGPRLIKFNCSGCQNLMYNDDELKGFVDVSAGFGEGEKWRTFGGHRMWVSPEEMPKTYYPDHEPVEYDIKEEGNKVIVTLTPPPQRVTDLQHKWVVTMDDTNELILDHYMTNVGKETVRKAIWGITVTDKKGIAVVRQPEKHAALLPNRHVVLWPYTNPADDRLLWGKDFIAIQQDPADTQVPLKIGYSNYEGKLYCFNHGQAMSIKFDSDYENGEYPDFNVPCEIYTNKNILEIESIGHLEDILPGNTISHREVYSAVVCDMKPTLNEEEIAKALEKAFG